MKRIAISFSLILLLLIVSSFQNNESFTGKVVAILDGDTIEVLKNGRKERIRLNGIDAPEKSQPFGNASKKFASEKLFGINVNVIVTGTDRYGRSLADVYANNEWFNLVSVSHGFSWHYKKYSDNTKLSEAEAAAKSAKLGLWADRNPIAPWDYRKSSSDNVAQ